MAVELVIHVIPSVRSRWVYLAAAGFCLLLLLFLVPQLVFRFYYQASFNSLGRDDLQATRTYLDDAKQWSGPLVLANDRKRIALVEGDYHLRRAETAKTVTDLNEEMEQAEGEFRNAIAIQPLDLDGYTGLVRATTALEKVYPFINKKPYPTKVLPLFERLRVLMPVNLYTQALLTKYYYANNMTDELNSIIGESVAIYPPLYFQLRQQPFYSTELDAMLKKSLNAAIARDVFPDNAYLALADLAQREENYQEAISYLLLARPVTPYRDNSAFDLKLADAYLQAGMLTEAEKSFLASLKTPDREKRLNAIWGRYNARKNCSEFLSFSRKIEDKNLTDQLEILQGKCLMAMDQPELATSHLIRISSPKYVAESMYLQARIAEGQKDWDTMELRSQRATVLDAKKSEYHLLFSRALNNQKKWPQAEQAVTDAIRYATVENPWLYNHRAWIRWHRNDYEGARKDWEKAIAIAPKTAGFYFSMSMIFERGGNTAEAIGYLKQAIALKPEEQSYRKKLSDLETLAAGKK